jgi:hypothetical protein
MPIRKILALPVPLGQANIPWPTFSLSTNERQAIVQGNIPAAKLGVSGTILSSASHSASQIVPPVSQTNVPPPTLQPVSQANVSPPKPGLQRSTGGAVNQNLANAVVGNPMLVNAQANQPTISLLPVGTSGGGNIVRSGTSILSGSGTPPVSSAPPTQPLRRSPSLPLSLTSNSNVVRSSGIVPPIVSSPPPPSLPPYQQSSMPARLLDSSAGRFALAAFIGPFISIMALFAGFAVGFLPVDLIILFGTGMLSDGCGIIVLRTRGNSDKARSLAGWGISLATFSMVVEIIRVVVVQIMH